MVGKTRRVAVGRSFVAAQEPPARLRSCRFEFHPNLKANAIVRVSDTSIVNDQKDTKGTTVWVDNLVKVTTMGDIKDQTVAWNITLSMTRCAYEIHVHTRAVASLACGHFGAARRISDFRSEKRIFPT